MRVVCDTAASVGKVRAKKGYFVPTSGALSKNTLPTSR